MFLHDAVIKDLVPAKLNCTKKRKEQTEKKIAAWCFNCILCHPFFVFFIAIQATKLL